MAPQDSETNQTKLIPSTAAHSFKAAIFHTMAFKLSLEINNDQITPSTKRSFLKVLYIVCKNKKKNVNFEQYAHLHFVGPKIAICVTVSNAVFVLNSSFTAKEKYFRVAIDEACETFDKVLLEFGYTQKYRFATQNVIKYMLPNSILYTDLKIKNSSLIFISILKSLHLLEMNAIE